jgi:hypothetical protein
VIHKNTVIVQCDRQKDSFVAAFDLKDGKEMWRTARAEIPGWGTPTVVAAGDGRSELVTNGTKAIRGYDADTGKERWTLSPNSEITCTTPVSGHGLIFVTAGYPPVRPVYAIKIGSTGDLTLKDGKDSSDAIAWSNKNGGSYLPSPLLYGDHLYLLNNNGVLTAYDGREPRVSTACWPGGSFVFAHRGSSKLYIASEEGDVFVVKAGAQYELIAKNSVGEPVLATRPRRRSVDVRGAKHLFAIADSKNNASSQGTKTNRHFWRLGVTTVFFPSWAKHFA